MGNYDNITIAKTGFTSVIIDTTVDEEVLQKVLTKITPGVSTKNYSSGKKDTKIVDLLQVEERINVDGHLSTDSTSDAKTKKDNLKALVKAGGVLTITYEGATFTANIEKISIKRNNSEGYEPADGEVGFDVKFSLIRGVNI